MNKSGIYKITNIINKKIYIGSSINMGIRISTHKYQLKNNKHCNKYLQRSYNKYGKDKFSFEKIDFCDENNLLLKEEYYINYFKSNLKEFGYNIGCFEKGRKRHNLETREKMSLNHKGKTRIFTDEWKNNISISNKGRKLTLEHKDKISKSKFNINRTPFTQKWKDNLRKSHEKYTISLYINEELIYENLGVTEASKILNVVPRTIYQAIKNNYKCKGYRIIMKNKL